MSRHARPGWPYLIAFPRPLGGVLYLDQFQLLIRAAIAKAAGDAV